MNRSRPYLSDEQTSTLMSGTWGRWAVRDRQMLTFLLHTGLKIREFVGLNVENVYTGKRVRQVLMVPTGRSNETRRVSLSREAREAIAIMLEFNRRHGFSMEADEPLVVSRQRNRNDGSYRITPRQVQRILKTLREDTHVEVRTTPQTLRHTYARELVNQGADLRELQRALGHRSIKTTRHLYGELYAGRD